MKNILKSIVFMTMAGLTISGCMNMTTHPDEITGSYTSRLNYKNFSCNELFAELGSLTRRENVLVEAQERRVKKSKVQAFWWGIGQGDGVEAAELADVRGEKEAVRTAIDANGCR